MARPIHHFLKEFGGGEAPFQPPLPKPAPQQPVIESGPSPDLIAIRVQEAYQKGIEEGRAIGRQAADTQAAELAIDFDRRTAETKSTFSQGLAEGLLDELRSGIDAARLRISTHAVTALMPMLREGLTRSAIASFVEELGGMIEMADGMVVEISCPAGLIEPVREALGEAMAKRGAPPGSVRCISGDTAEVRVSLNDTVIETRLAEWLTRLEGVLR